MDFACNPTCFPASDENSLYLDFEFGDVCYLEVFAK